MKKLLGVCTLAGVLLLSACRDGNRGVTVCTDVSGHAIEAHHEAGTITSFVMTETEEISDNDDESIDFLMAMLDAMPEVTYTLDDGILTMTTTLEAETISATLPDTILDLDEFIADAQANGSTCE